MTLFPEVSKSIWCSTKKLWSFISRAVCENHDVKLCRCVGKDYELGIFFIKHTQKHLRWSNKWGNYENCSPAFMYKLFLCFKSGIKAINVDFRSIQPAVELCSIKNCEKLDDSAENISKIDSG